MITDELYMYLLNGVEQLNLKITDIQLAKLIQYLNLLSKWNKVYSLTAITKPKEMIDLHLLDGISILPEFDKLSNVKRIIDVGSGMGVPGIILAICRPELEVVVLDSNQKKTAFLQQVKIELMLPNLQVINHRVETLNNIELFDVAISRAFADTNLFVTLCEHLVKPSGVFLAMKGQKAHLEATDIKHYKIEIIEIKVPHLEQKRFVTRVSR